MLAYEVVGDIVEEYMRMSESTYLRSMYMFSKVVPKVFNKVYLREPYVVDIVQLLPITSQEGFI
jgi:hypothetical protein